MIEDVTAGKRYSDIVRTYRVVGCRILAAADRPIGDWGPVGPALKTNRDYAWSPGDIRLDVFINWCRQDLRECRQRRQDPFMETYLVRKLDVGHWRLVDWSMGDVFPLQGHVERRACRFEDEDLHILTQEAASPRPCVGPHSTPLCDLETRLAEEMKNEQAAAPDVRIYIKYKVIDCETLDATPLFPGRWDPRPVESPWLLSHKKRADLWMPGDVRLGIRWQICNAVDKSCKAPMDFITISHKDDGNWSEHGSRESKMSRQLE
jgi:hypothetical protein